MLFAMLPANAQANTSMLSPQVISGPVAGSAVTTILQAGDDVTLIAGAVVTGTITVPVGRTLTLNGGTISGGTNSGVLVNGGTFIMQSGTISGNTAGTSWGGSGVFVRNNGTFTMNGGTITGNSSNNHGGGVTVMESSTFTMNGGTIADNTAGGGARGGGVHMAGTATFHMTGGVIENNNASTGGGVNVENIGGSFNMTGGYIRNHDIVGHGGGVNNSGTFTMTNGTIYNNTANRGGGVNLQGPNNKFTMSGNAVIYDNTANSVGGGVGVFQGTLTMNGGLIDDNNANNGGGLWISNSNVTINNGTISNNTATVTGGGIVLQNVEASLEINAGEISGNTAADGGGLGFLLSDPNPVESHFQQFLDKVTIAPAVEFTGNTAAEIRVNEALNDDNPLIAPGEVSLTPPGHAFTNFDIHTPASEDCDVCEQYPCECCDVCDEFPCECPCDVCELYPCVCPPSCGCEEPCPCGCDCNQPTGFYVTFAPGIGGGGTPPPVQGQYAYETIVVTPVTSALTRPGFVQVAWRVDHPTSGALVMMGGTFVLRGNHTLYAEWMPAS